MGNTFSAKIFAKYANRFASHSLRISDPELVMIGLDDICNGIFSIERDQLDVIEWLKESTQSPCSVVFQQYPKFGSTSMTEETECWVHFSSKSDAALFKMAFV